MFDVQAINLHEFQVLAGSSNYVVDFLHKTCTCRVFDVDKIPCQHAIAVAKKTGVDPQLLADPYYTKPYWFSAYSESIKPAEELPELSADNIGQICLPPDTHVGVQEVRKEEIPRN
ncbi:unnamed protein product [Microthlaspi erraticum]|uniref:SWIM-type domain-containing protein n=1 Tax=Microthlaspi erraticum TaxID=1685480 RepID=A0A6D2JHV5_9BRAS|nr:unnamed protein product [Microthlaspi erraticum]CAA7039426.1 unnamed protein product [Microthlaspi erraticum]